MPELPEVEVMTRQLARRLRGRNIRRVEVRDPKLGLSPSALVGRRIQRIRRRAKFIILNLDGDRHLLVHLRMTGWFVFRPPPQYRVAIHTTGATAYFTDSRRFGRMCVVDDAGLRHALADLGPEPLTGGCDLSRLAGSARAIKVALLDQRLVAGIGNIYASESLWRARLHPRRRACRLRVAELRRLRLAITRTLRQAIAWGEAIFDNYGALAVYDRAGRPCRRCGQAIRRIVQQQRSTYFCPSCQH